MNLLKCNERGTSRTCCHHLRLALRILGQHQAGAVTQTQAASDVERLQWRTGGRQPSRCVEEQTQVLRHRACGKAVPREPPT